MRGRGEGKESMHARRKEHEGLRGKECSMGGKMT